MNLLYAQRGSSPQGAGGGIMMLVPFILIFVVFYFMIIMPQRQQQKKHRELLKNLNKGNKIVTSGGIHGSIIKIGEDTVTIQTCPKSELTIDRSVIARILS